MPRLMQQKETRSKKAMPRRVSRLFQVASSSPSNSVHSLICRLLFFLLLLLCSAVRPDPCCRNDQIPSST